MHWISAILKPVTAHDTSGRAQMNQLFKAQRFFIHYFPLMTKHSTDKAALTHKCTAFQHSRSYSHHNCRGASAVVRPTLLEVRNVVQSYWICRGATGITEPPAVFLPSTLDPSLANKEYGLPTSFNDKTTLEKIFFCSLSSILHQFIPHYTTSSYKFFDLCDPGTGAKSQVKCQVPRRLLRP